MSNLQILCETPNSVAFHMLVVINNPVLLVSVARHLDLHELMSARSSVIQDSGGCMGVA